MKKQWDELNRDIFSVLPYQGGASSGLTFKGICDAINKRCKKPIGWCWRMETDVATCLSYLQRVGKVVKNDFGHEYRYCRTSYKRKWGSGKTFPRQMWCS